MPFWRLGLLIGVAAACSPSPGAVGSAGPLSAQLEGTWRACLTEETRSAGPICGTLVARSYAAQRAGRRAEGYLLSHDIPLAELLRSANKIPSYGAAHRTQE